MATWLNALLSGACTIDVYRDAVLVSDLAAVDAVLTTTGGTIQLTTPTDESHTWEVVVTADFLLSPTKLRMKAFDFDGLPGLTTAQARLWLNGSLVETDALTLGPPAGPDPVAFTDFGNAATLHLDET